MPKDKVGKGIKVALTFYTPGLEHTVVWEFMPQIPRIGDTVHYALGQGIDGSRAWRVMHVSWVCDDYTRNVWHAEIGLD